MRGSDRLADVEPVEFAASRARRRPRTEAKEKDEAAKQKEVDPRVERMVIQPGEPKSDVQAVKPGHWVTGTERMRAMYQDFVGTLDTTVVNGRGEPYPVDATPYVLESTRPVALSKGQPKDIETTFLVPQVARAIQVRNEMVERGFGRSMRSQLPVTRMPSYQYYFVVLAEEPNRYAFVKTLDSVTVPWDGETEVDDTEDPLHYRVVSLPVDRTIPLSDNPLTWTGIAYVLWDEVDPKLFTPEQARALVDWLHWGGQLVVSGPDSLDLLKGSFLEPYLPATSGGSGQIAADDLSELNRHWLITRAGGEQTAGADDAVVGHRAGVAGAEGRSRRAGRAHGRAVDGAGRGARADRGLGDAARGARSGELAERVFRACSTAAFCGGRTASIGTGYYDELTLAWADPKLTDRRLDARPDDGLAISSRGIWGVDSNYKYVDVAVEGAGCTWQTPEQKTMRELKPPEQAGGIGAWNDFSATAKVARESLVEAAGVEVPDTSFVVLCLAIYLVVLVPLNWLVFSAIGRVEWAWIAAPIIAIAGTWAIVDRARLDIGFVRAQTEIGVLELQPNYDRGASVAVHGALHVALDDVRLGVRESDGGGGAVSDGSQFEGRRSQKPRRAVRLCEYRAVRCGAADRRVRAVEHDEHGPQRADVCARRGDPVRAVGVAGSAADREPVEAFALERGARRADVARGGGGRHEAAAAGHVDRRAAARRIAAGAVFVADRCWRRASRRLRRSERRKTKLQTHAAAQPGADVPPGAGREEFRAGGEAAGRPHRRGARRARRSRRRRRRCAAACWWWPIWNMARGRSRSRISTRAATWWCRRRSQEFEIRWMSGRDDYLKQCAEPHRSTLYPESCPLVSCHL